MGLPVDDAAVPVTGSSSGIGAALAGELARRGARVGLVGRRAEKLEAVAEADRAYAIRTLRGSAATRPFEVSPLAVTFEWHQIQRAHLNIFADPDSGARIRSWAERTVSVDSWQWIAGKEGEVRNDLPGRWTATDVHGNRWVMFADNER